MSALFDEYPPSPIRTKTPEELAAAAKVCKRQGHDDVTRTPRLRRAYPMVECLRCGRVGWLAPS